MKTFKLIFLVALIFLSRKAISQSSSHPTIDEVKVKYRSVPSSSVNSSSMVFNVIPEINIALKSTSGISKIYLKIIEIETSTTLFTINYNLNSSAVTNANGDKLFENNNGQIFISSGTSLLLKPYTYEVYTENNQSISTSVFSSIQ